MEKVRMTLKISNNDLDEYRKELFNKILNDPNYKVLVKEGFSNEEIYKNVTKFDEFLEDLKIAQKIKTYDDCKAFNKVERIILYRNGEIIEKQYIPLAPYQDYLDNIKKFIIRDIPSGDEEAKWENLSQGLKRFISQKLKENKWVYLYGAVRSGRSYAASAMTNRKYIKECDSIAFINCPVRFKELSELYFKDSVYFKELMTEYSNVDYLVLDEFGSEYKNELIRDSILIPLLKARITNKKITSFTSDFKIDDVRRLYTFKKDNNTIMLEQLMDLLQTNCGKEIVTSTLSIY